MAFITRLARLMRADLHAMLDRLEAPDLVLAQAIREMEQAQEEDRRGLVRLEHEHVRLREQAAELARAMEQQETALDDCLSAGQDDLARSVVRRRLETERQAGALGQRLRTLTGECETRRQRLSEQETRLADLRARAALFDLPNDSGAGPEAWSPAGERVGDAEVEVALLRARRQREARR